MADPTDRCELCDGAAEPLDPLVPDEFYPGVHLHLHCLNSAGGIAWRRHRAATDPLYARYLQLIMVGYEVHCSSCGSPERLAPKAMGMGAGRWEVNCRSCHHHQPLVNAYRGPAERELHTVLSTLAHDFKLSRNPARVLGRVEQLANESDALLAAQRCSCGDRFSLAAHPRCSGCKEVLLESPFHFALPAAGSDAS